MFDETDGDVNHDILNVEASYDMYVDVPVGEIDFVGIVDSECVDKVVFDVDDKHLAG